MFNQKKKYFLHKLNGVQKMIWDLEFKREKTLMIREEVRREYDAVSAKLEIVRTQKKTFPALDPALEGKDKAEKWTDEQRRVDDQDVTLTRDQERYIAQMKQMDIDVSGSPKTNEHPDGVDGINQQLDSLRELQGMIREYRNKI